LGNNKEEQKMAIKGFVRNFKPLELLNEEQFQSIHRATLDVLQNVGIRIEHEGP
jgi:trimethylamine:corrinoid methyltransferase-like protein